MSVFDECIWQLKKSKFAPSSVMMTWSTYVYYKQIAKSKSMVSRLKQRYGHTNS